MLSYSFSAVLRGSYPCQSVEDAECSTAILSTNVICYLKHLVDVDALKRREKRRLGHVHRGIDWFREVVVNTAKGLEIEGVARVKHFLHSTNSRAFCMVNTSRKLV